MRTGPRYFAHLGVLPPALSTAEQRALVVRAQAGDRAARATLVATNLRFVVYAVMRRYRRFLERSDSELVHDLMQEGAVALNHAIDRFDTREEGSFITYAAWWIRSHTSKFLIQNHTTGMGMTQREGELFWKLLAVEARLRRELSREPSTEEVAAACGREDVTYTPEQVARARRHLWPALSLQEPVQRAGDGDRFETYEDRLEDEGPTAEAQLLDAAAAGDLHERVAKVVAAFHVRERAIITYRWMRDGHEQATLAELGWWFGVSRERMRQLERDLLPRLTRLLQAAEATDE